MNNQFLTVLGLALLPALGNFGGGVLAEWLRPGKVKRLLLSASCVVPVVTAAVLAYFALRGQSEGLKMIALVFVAGLYILAAVEDMLREAHESAEESRWSAFSLIAGFALFLLVSSGLG